MVLTNSTSMLFITFFTCAFCLMLKTDAARILAVFPTPSISHQIVFRPLTQELARRGHKVVVITTDPAFPKSKSPENLTEIDVHEISYKVWNEELKNIMAGNNNYIEYQVNLFIQLFSAVLEQQLRYKEVQDLIKKKHIHFDLILVEVCVRPAIIYSHIFKAPVIQLSSLGPMVGTNNIIGAPSHPLYQPIILRQRFYNLSFWEKIREIYRQLKFEYINNEFICEEDVMVKNIFGPDTPSMHELLNNVDMVFLNLHPIWNNNAPVPPGVIYMGGLHQQPAKELPKEFLLYLDSSENGIIYISFGTNVKSSMLPLETITIMTKVLSELSYDVIWKWDTDLPEKPANIRIFKWLPQSDLLRHPKLKLFIMQGGLQSTDEAITGGVPMIGMPVIADQWYNVEKYVHLGIGQHLEIGAFTEAEFRNSVITIIENKSYRNNILRLRAFLNDQPQTPLERAIWWIEYVLRHGGARHLRSPAANMSWAEYYELKLVSILLICLFTIFVAFIVILRYLLPCILKKLLKLKSKIL